MERGVHIRWNIQLTTANVRKTNYFGTSTTTQLSQGSYSTYDGTLALQRDGNHVVSSRYDDARTESTTWGPQDFPTTWKLRHPWVKLWDAQSKQTHEGVMPGCSTEVRYDNRRLVLMPKWELAAAVSGCTTAKSVDSKVHLEYHATSNDQLHTESSVDLGIMRLNVVELYLGDFLLPTTSTIRVTFSGGGLTTPVIQEYEVVPLAHQSRGSDSSKIGVFEFILDAPVLTAMKAMSSGTSMSIDILLDTLQWDPSPYFVEFAAHAEDVAPRITGVINSIVPIYRDATVNDFSSQVRYFTDLLKVTSISKLDDVGSTPEPTTWTPSLTTLDGRYTKVNGQYDAVNTSLSMGATLGNPYTSSTVSWATSKLSAGGMALSTAYPNVNLTAQTIAPDQNGTALSKWTSQFPTPATTSPTTLTSQTFAGSAGSLLYSESENASMTSLTSVDLFGRVLSCSTGTGTGALVTTFEYEPMTNLLSKVITPAGSPISFVYDAFGRTTQITHPDLGVTKYKYDDRGLLRFVQTAMQAIPNNERTRVTYYEYDDLGRQILTGEALLASGVTFAQLDSSKISIGTSSSEPTRNRTMFNTGGTAPPIVSLKRVLNQCVPEWGLSQRPPYEQFAANIANIEAFVRPAMVIPYPGDFGQFGTAATGATAANFENVGLFPEHPRTAVLYDEFLLDQVNNRIPGNIWGGLPQRTTLECLTPTGSFRNLSGRAVAVAYRDHGKDKFWYKAYSYDEKGRIECEIRIDDNLGIGVTYFTYNDAGSPICIRQVDAIRNHATWYAYDDNGRVSKMWTALSDPDALNGLGAAAQDNDQTVRCYSTMNANFVLRPANPDVMYAYDAMGRLTGKVYNNADVAGNITEAINYNWRLALEHKQAIVAGMPVKNIADQALSYQDDMQVSVNSLDGRGTNDRITNETYDDKGRLITTLSTPDPNNTYTLDPLSRRTQTVKNWLTPLPPPEVNNYIYPPTNTAIAGVNSTGLIPDYITHNWDASGRVASRTIGSATGPVTETTSFGYHDRLLNLVLTMPAPTGVQCPFTELNEGDNYSLKDSWTYRYGPGGIREQKRLMTSPQHDRMSCGVAPWVAYVISPGGQQLAVYHGRQVSENICAPAGFGYYERRVHIYPVEFRSYGPDGINVIFERNAGCVMTKRFVTTNNQGSIVSVTDNAGYEASAVYDNFGTPMNAYTRRTGWLDRERDFETSPLSDKHKLYDLEARKYDASTGQFLSVDPLWMQFLSSSSYVYCEGDPVNGIDPWGLAGDGDPKGPGGPSKPDGTTTPVSRWFQRYFSIWDEHGISEDRPREDLLGPVGGGGSSTGGAWAPPARKQPSTHVKGKGIPGPYRIPRYVFTDDVVVTATRLANDSRSSVDDWVTAFGASYTIVHGTTEGMVGEALRYHERAMIARQAKTLAAPIGLGAGVRGFMKASKVVGIVGTLADVGYRGAVLIDSPSNQTALKLGVSIAIPFFVFVPVVGWGLVIGLTAAELIWGDQLYNSVSDERW